MNSFSDLYLDSILNSNVKPVAFVGSGLSSNYPSWEEFVKKLIKLTEKTDGFDELFVDSKVQDTHDLMAIADICNDYFSGNYAELQNFLKQVFPKPDVEDIPAVYRSLVRAPFSFFITTNYDTNLEDAYLEFRGQQLPVVLPSQPEEALRRITCQDLPFLFKIHGCVRNGGPYVIGAHDYRNITYGQMGLKYVLSSIFASLPVIFMGYGQRDPHINMYLESRQQYLPSNVLKHYTFVRKPEVSSHILRYYRNVLGIKSIQIQDWNDISKYLSQMTILRMNRQYDTVRRDTSQDFKEFIQQSNQKAAFGALIHCTASIGCGRSEPAKVLNQTIKNNSILESSIDNVPLLKYIFNLMMGQLDNRLEKLKSAKEHFQIIEKETQNSIDIVAPIKALGLKYAAIYWFWMKSNPDFTKAEKLLIWADELLGDKFPTESLDISKWKALLLASQGEITEGIKQLVSTANKAHKIGYSQNHAWCIFNAVEQAYKGERFNILPNSPNTMLDRAIELFESLEHFRGLAECYLLSYKLSDKFEYKLYDPLERLQLSEAYATISGVKHVKREAQSILQNTIHNL